MLSTSVGSGGFTEKANIVLLDWLTEPAATGFWLPRGHNVDSELWRLR